MNTIYLALGDSITTGYGVGTNQSFAALFYKNLLAFDPGLQYVNLGVNGLTSMELASMVRQERLCSLIAQAKIISLTIGSNDLLAVGKGFISGAGANIDLALGNFNQNFMFIGNQIRAINPSVLVKAATIYNPLPPMNKEVDAYAMGLVKAANHQIKRVAREFRFVVVPVAKAFSGQEQLLLGPDHLHPNVMGHRVMADLFSVN
ncbi:SGNH/GDSL hydrolase family protein [Desulfitobacterium sp.]|uniref:SGNH/GDSL hydrolase family protein n=1 Tax=Desulfitobacterium sp. TaxID=49981 RepID=UPI002B20EABB|nr:GDSL-type esterase/lipase family protein [Desulfitobacterium sp.]MEA4902277.1 GDSL-type esterase/lipase family protein [Desulfitobacterium sp.]